MQVESVCAPGVVRVASERSSGGGAWRSARLAVWSSRVSPHGERSEATLGRRVGCAGGVNRRSGLVLLGCLVAFNAWAQSSRDTAQEATDVRQQVARHQTEVQRLQQDVSQQESASQQAAQKQQQQDQAIAELRKQIEAARQASKVPSGKH